MLEHIDLDVAPTGLHLVISAEAAEKRLLVRALCGPRSQHVKLLGEALFRGEPLSDQVGPVTIQTDARLAMSSVQDFLLQGPMVAGVSRASRLASCLEQIEEAGFPALCDKLQEVLCDLDATERVVVEVIRLRQKSPALLVLDEPLDSAPKDIQERLVAWLVREAQVRALLIFVADPAPFVAAVPDLTLLWLLNGEIHRTAPRQPDPAPSALVDAALAAPIALHQGQDLASEPPADPEVPQYTEVVSHEPVQGRSRGMGPRGFQWLQPGQLAGLPAPGAMNDVEYDLDLIRGAGVDVLVTLTFERPALAIMDKIGLKSLYCPMEDMSVPSCEAAAELCKNVSAYLAKNQAVAYHCKAGLGRTGTMLATQLIWEGADARTALDRVRSVEAGWVQSGAQEQFLQRFERWMNDHNESVGTSG
jgi:atypical dual specificity phosphatase